MSNWMASNEEEVVDGWYVWMEKDKGASRGKRSGVKFELELEERARAVVSSKAVAVDRAG